MRMVVAVVRVAMNCPSGLGTQYGDAACPELNRVSFHIMHG